MKTVWLIQEEASHSNINIYKFSALRKQITEFNEVGYFDEILSDGIVEYMFTLENITLEQYGFNHEADLLQVIGCLDSIAEFKKSHTCFTLDCVKYFQAITDFIKRYDGIEDNKKFFCAIG
jgi:hypothetical protein